MSDLLNSPAIFVSPHSDDICFSLGGMAMDRAAEGTLITLFTRSVYAPSVPGLPAWPEDRVRFVSELRASEDQAFADQCGLERIELNLPEPTISARHPFGPPRRGDAFRVHNELFPVLFQLQERYAGTRPWLFLPLGVGDHVDHIAVFLFALLNLNYLSEHFQVAFYEDLPYAGHLEKRSRAIERIRKSLAPHELQRSTYDIRHKEREKYKLIQLYSSQLTWENRIIDAFVPATGDDLFIHEAWWTLK